MYSQLLILFYTFAIIASMVITNIDAVKPKRTKFPTFQPSVSPTSSHPSNHPTKLPTLKPTKPTTKTPTQRPTHQPRSPTLKPTKPTKFVLTSKPTTSKPTTAAPLPPPPQSGGGVEYEYENGDEQTLADLGEDCTVLECKEPYLCSNTFQICYDPVACKSACTARSAKLCNKPVTTTVGCSCTVVARKCAVEG
jgi:hypothetical protein